MSRLAVVLMVRNEAARIAYTLKSCTHELISGVIVYDTGSTDNTLDVIRSTVAEMPNIEHLDILEGEFVDFATSRNINLEYARECATKHGYDYFLLLDSNDELTIEKDFNPDSLDKDTAVWLVNCEWLIGPGTKSISFKNTKFVRADVPDLKWVGVVHEYLSSGKHKRGSIDTIRVFQDRIKDNDGKTKERWERDRVLLENEYKNNNTDLRTLFYLAQTYSCLGENKLAYDHYEKRANSAGGFYEEQYVSLCKCGELAVITGRPITVAIEWYTRAFMNAERAEPLVAIAELYAVIRQYKLAYAFAKLACSILYPESALLFVDVDCYEYRRWHTLGKLAWYASQQSQDPELIMKDGYDACKRAIEARKLDIDKSNLKFYA